MRLGVETPEEGLLPIMRATPAPKISGMLEEEGEGDRKVGVAGAELRFNEECLGGDGARVEEWCVGFVRSLDIEAVAVDVPDEAAGGGERGRKAGGFNRSGVAGFSASLIGGCSSRILRRH
jgi:hypothetical protein